MQSDTQGLTQEKADELLLKHGFNELPAGGGSTFWKIMLDVVREPMFMLLIACGLLYILLGDHTEGIILISTIVILIGITFFQNQKSEKALLALKQLATPRVLVIRDGEKKNIAGRDLVPGDLILLHEGDRVAADCHLIESVNLAVDESMLTGESIAVEKNNPETDFLFSGTMIVKGAGIAKVFATGLQSHLGKIAGSLASVVNDQTRLQVEMKIFIRRLALIGVIICVGIVLAFYFTRGNLLESILSGLSSAMAIMPEEFPVVLTVFLSLGAWRLSKQKVLTRKPSAIETLGSATVLCSDKTGTITANKMKVVAIVKNSLLVSDTDFENQFEKIEEIIRVAKYASQPTAIDPMDKAIFELPGEISDAQILIREYPLSKELLAITRVVKTEYNQTIIACKGSPEAVMNLCKMSAEQENEIRNKINELASDGKRILGVATGEASKEIFPEKQSELKFTWLGLLAFEDPVREGVKESVHDCYTAGIKVVMITGDYPVTAKSIALQAGFNSPVQVVTGDEINTWSDGELKNKIKSIDVFARVVPEQKLRIVRAFQQNNEVVAMTGDGVNDAPALKAADIGIAMGNKGTDVAREASSLVLLDDNFSSIVAAIRGGRRIYDNLQKAMSYILAIHIPIIGLTLIPAFFSDLPLLLLPIHIVFLELIIDPVCSIAFESEQEEKIIMQRPPRNPVAKFFSMKKILYSLADGLLLLGIVAGVYFLSLEEGHTDGEVRAIAFSSLVLGNIFLILTKLSKSRSVFAVLAERNKWVMIILTLALLFNILSITLPPLLTIFNFEFPGLFHFIPAIGGAVLLLAILEFIKLIRWRKVKEKMMNG